MFFNESKLFIFYCYYLSLQEIHQARLQSNLGDIRKAVSEVKVDSQRKLADYQKECATADKEIASCEKKLSRSKELFEKACESKQK
jgi:hypothetical protein